MEDIDDDDDLDTEIVIDPPLQFEEGYEVTNADRVGDEDNVDSQGNIQSKPKAKRQKEIKFEGEITDNRRGKRKLPLETEVVYIGEESEEEDDAAYAKNLLKDERLPQLPKSKFGKRQLVSRSVLGSTEPEEIMTGLQSRAYDRVHNQFYTYDDQFRAGDDLSDIRENEKLERDRKHAYKQIAHHRKSVDPDKDSEIARYQARIGRIDRRAEHLYQKITAKIDEEERLKQQNIIRNNPASTSSNSSLGQPSYADMRVTQVDDDPTLVKTEFVNVKKERIKAEPRSTASVSAPIEESVRQQRKRKKNELEEHNQEVEEVKTPLTSAARYIAAAEALAEAKARFEEATSNFEASQNRYFQDNP